MRRLVAVVCILTVCCMCNAQTERDVVRAVTPYFEHYSNSAYNTAEKIRVVSARLDRKAKGVDILMNEVFLGQPFTTALVDSIYANVRTYLPESCRQWKLQIKVNGSPIEFLVPYSLQQRHDTLRTWGNMKYTGNPWTLNLDRPFAPTHGLQGRHVCLWASHGRFYSVDKRKWQWQRPKMFNTCEDIFTQTIVLQYLMPMMENAGAVVYSPRERDIQRHEVIVDNDIDFADGIYSEINGKHEWEDAGIGFARVRTVYVDGQNPFEEGTCRKIVTQNSKTLRSSITWTPDIREDGEYAVYVSYKTLPTSVPDAVYSIRHKGVTTRVRVNQQMGGGTWVYLGTFDFGCNSEHDNCITLTNHSNYRGHITADAVRLGGGMGNIARGDSTVISEGDSICTSGLPRYLECSRYSMQWNGAPRQIYTAYSSMNSANDYNDDLYARSLGANYIAGGSVYVPVDTIPVANVPGLKVPIDMCVATHSDAGLRENMDIVGTLGVYTTQFYNGKLASGLNRLVSRDLADMVMTGFTADMQQMLGNWSRRQMYDRNYCETREPQMPSMILETMSHQNYADMLVGHDPVCKFVMARAIYKALLRYEAMMHEQKKVVVQPLPVKNVKAVADAVSGSISLSWSPVTDPVEKSAKPWGYVVYTRRGSSAWNNGRVVRDTVENIEAAAGVLYQFRVAALNDGGCSLKSAEVCARVPWNPKADNIMIVNGFERLAAPQAFANDSVRGFDMNTDPGVAYYRNISIYDINGVPVAGNTFDYPTMHARDLLMTDSASVALHDLAISSCTMDAVRENTLSGYRLVDMICGAQRVDGYSHRTYKTMPEQMQKVLRSYTTGGGSLLVSGAYIGEDMQDSLSMLFTRDVLKYEYDGDVETDSLMIPVAETGDSLQLYSVPNETRYWTKRVNILKPAEKAEATLSYGPQSPASVGYKGNDYKVLSYGFPLEMITDNKLRRALINASYKYLCSK